jgi:hypothetical protein
LPIQNEPPTSTAFTASIPVSANGAIQARPITSKFLSALRLFCPSPLNTPTE